MDEKEYEIGKEKNKIESQKLKFEKYKFDNSNKFISKNLGVIITAMLSIATISVSFIQFYKAQTTKKIELDIEKTRLSMTEVESNRRYRLDVTKFIMDNSETIFNGTLLEQERMKNVMLASFPPDINERIFANIKATKNDSLSQDVWEQGEIQAEKIYRDNRTESVKKGESDQYYINLFRSSNRAIRQEASKLLTQKEDRQTTVNKLIDNIRPDTVTASYRINFYIALTLYKMPEKWTTNEERIRKFKALTKSVNYKDYHFKKYVDLAIENLEINQE